MHPSIVLAMFVFAVAIAAVPALGLSGAAVNPCKLVTAADAKAVLGAAPGKPKLQDAGLYQSCTYVAGNLTLTVLMRQLTKSMFVKSAKANPGPVVSIAGIGESAYSVSGGSGLLVWKNGTEATFAIFGDGKGLKLEEQLARTVVGNSSPWAQTLERLSRARRNCSAGCAGSIPPYPSSSTAPHS